MICGKLSALLVKRNNSIFFFLEESHQRTQNGSAFILLPNWEGAE
jgi:hypothetical protein